MTHRPDHPREPRPDTDAVAEEVPDMTYRADHPRKPGLHTDTVAEGSAKQFARGVGDDHVDERMAADPHPTETVKSERVPAGSGKQFARGVGEPTPTDPVHNHPSDTLDELRQPPGS